MQTLVRLTCEGSDGDKLLARALKALERAGFSITPNTNAKGALARKPHGGFPDEQDS